MQTLRTHLRSIVRRYKVEVLVIDYIQLFKMEKVERRKRNERIAEASQEVKRLANELGIAIIEVAQFNREGAKSVQAGLHDLEGSGQLEKDASIIFILELSDGENLRPIKRESIETPICGS
jgi:replicative DNA helicase